MPGAVHPAVDDRARQLVSRVPVVDALPARGGPRLRPAAGEVVPGQVLADARPPPVRAVGAPARVAGGCGPAPSGRARPDRRARKSDAPACRGCTAGRRARGLCSTPASSGRTAAAPGWSRRGWRVRGPHPKTGGWASAVAGVLDEVRGPGDATAHPARVQVSSSRHMAGRGMANRERGRENAMRAARSGEQAARRLGRVTRRGRAGVGPRSPSRRPYRPCRRRRPASPAPAPACRR